MYIPMDPQDPTKQLKVEIDYQKWGTNYFSGNTERRGFYIYFRWVNRDTTSNPNFVTESFILYWEKKDWKILLKETSRNSKKQLQDLQNKLRETFTKQALLDMYNKQDFTPLYSM